MSPTDSQTDVPTPFNPSYCQKNPTNSSTLCLTKTPQPPTDALTTIDSQNPQPERRPDADKTTFQRRPSHAIANILTPFVSAAPTNRGPDTVCDAVRQTLSAQTNPRRRSTHVLTPIDPRCCRHLEAVRVHSSDLPSFQPTPQRRSTHILTLSDPRCRRHPEVPRLIHSSD